MTTPLEYAPTQKWHQRRRFRRAMVQLIILAALSLAAWQFAPPIFKKFRMLYYQHQCMNYINTPPFPTTSNSIPQPAPPPELTNFLAEVSPPTLAQELLGWPTPKPGLFLPNMFRAMHTLERSGEKRLVVVTQLCWSDDTIPGNVTPHTAIQMSLFKPATLFSKPEYIDTTYLSLENFGHQNFYLIPANSPAADLANTKVDPANPSAFILPAEFLPDLKHLSLSKPRLRFRLSVELDKIEDTIEETP